MASIDLQHTWRHGGLHQIGDRPESDTLSMGKPAFGYEIRQAAREVGDHIDPKTLRSSQRET
jgi:hypothetical protein